MEDGEEKEWKPKNANGYFTYSNMTLRRALAQSINSVTAQLTDDVGASQCGALCQKDGNYNAIESSTFYRTWAF